MKYYIIAGEASGDLHASNLILEIKKIDADAQFRCWGGDLMEQAGATLVKHYKDLDFMGFVEVILNLRTILANIKQCKRDIKAYEPDQLILVDYPGFNLRLAKFAYELGINVNYYICPQIWAWKESRVKTIKKYVHRLFVILPFEQQFYAKHAVESNFVGHPLLDQFHAKHAPSNDFRKEYNLGSKPIIALLPGSRKQEIKKMLPIMSETSKHFKNYQFVLACTKHISPEFYHRYCSNKEVNFLIGKTYEILQNSTAAMVTSGTATLETALFDVPQVVCYKGNPLSIFIGRMLIKVKFISLVNLIMDKKIVSELIQDECNTKNLTEELEAILPGNSGYDKLKNEYKTLLIKLGGPGASARTARLIVGNKIEK